MSQLAINFFPVRARRTDPATSHEAGLKAHVFAASQAGRILAALTLHGAQSASQLSLIMGLTVVQLDRRLPELKKQGLARLTGDVFGGCRVWAAI